MDERGDLAHTTFVLFGKDNELIMKNNIDRFLFYVAKVFLMLFLIMIWVLIGLVALSFHDYEGFVIFEDFYGKWSLWVGAGLALLAFLSSLYLMVFVKKRWMTVLSLALPIILVLTFWGALSFVNSQLGEFTPDKWERYPRQRYIMLESLEANHGIIGMITDEVISILGEPDYFSQDKLEYEHGMGFIVFRTRDDVVVSMMSIYPRYYGSPRQRDD